MDTNEFRKRAHEIADWIADYAENVGGLPVAPPVRPGEIRAALPKAAPEDPEDFDAIFRDFKDIIVPGMTHWNHPRWFAYFPANNSPPSVLAEMLTAALGAQCMSWATSPAATELEQVVMEWLRRLLDLPEGFRGVIQDTASTSTLVAILSARERATEYRFAEEGGALDTAGRLTVYASTQAHSSIDKAVRIAGLGLERLRRIPVDETYAMIPEALEEAVTRDLSQGLRPGCVVACVGTTSSSALDSLEAIGPICKRHGVWLHVDAAYAGSAAILPECRDMLSGIEYVDSFVFNPHKWLFTNFDCSAYFVRDTEPLLRTFGLTPEYLRTEFDEKAVNYRDWGIQLGRRFRALKLWFVLREFGASGLRDILRRHISLAKDFASWVEDSPDFELLAPVPLGLVCFRLKPEDWTGDDLALDELNERLLKAVNDTARVHLTHTRLDGRFTLRLSVGQLHTEKKDVEEAWRLVKTHGAGLTA